MLCLGYNVPMKKIRNLSRHEIARILVIKLLALYAIWFFFVDGHKVRPVADSVYQHVFLGEG